MWYTINSCRNIEKGSERGMNENNDIDINKLLNGVRAETLLGIDIRKSMWAETYKDPAVWLFRGVCVFLLIIVICFIRDSINPNSEMNKTEREQNRIIARAPEMFISPLTGGFDYTTGTFLYYATLEGLKANPQNYGKVLEYQGNDMINYRVNFQKAWSRADFKE
jgi:hypothetical protein